MSAGRSQPISSVVKVVLDVTWYVGALGVALIVVALCLAAVSNRPGLLDLSFPVSFELDLDAYGLTYESARLEGARIEDASGVLDIAVRQRGLVLGVAAGVAVLGALALWVLGQLRAVFRTLREGRPFVPANVRRIRWVGVGVIAGELLGDALGFAGNYYTAAHFAAEGIRFTSWPDIDVATIISGLVILAIAEVFNAGTRLEEDQSLTV